MILSNPKRITNITGIVKIKTKKGDKIIIIIITIRNTQIFFPKLLLAVYFRSFAKNKFTVKHLF